MITPLDCCAAASPVAVEELRQLRERIKQLEQGGVMSFDGWLHTRESEMQRHMGRVVEAYMKDAWNAALDAAAKVARELDKWGDWESDMEDKEMIAAAIERLKEAI
jgi:RNA polymerase-interacting CarD/CdnL/TRCF family regulator